MLKGEVHLVFRDVNTGEITKELTESNVVTNYGLSIAANAQPQNDGWPNRGDYGRFPSVIWIGGWLQEATVDFHYMYDLYQVGSTEAGVDQPRFLTGNVGTGGTFANYYEYQQRFTPPTTTRTIYTIGLSRSASHTLDYQRPMFAWAYLSLSSPCTQTPTETLDIFYRIIWDNPNPAVSGLSDHQMDVIARRHMNNDGNIFDSHQPEYPARHACFYYQGRKMLPFVSGDMTSTGRMGAFAALATYNSTWLARELVSSVDIGENLGRIFGAISFDDADGHQRHAFPVVTVRNDFAVESPVQNIFPHKAASTGPFYQSSGLATGLGTISIDGSGWTNPDFNKLLQVEITQGGALGASEYKLYVMNTTGFVQNSYRHAEVAIPCLHGYDTFEGADIFDTSSSSSNLTYTGSHMMNYARHETKTILFDVDWVGKVDIMTCERKRFYDTSTPAFTGTDINQIVTVPNTNAGSLVSGDIWVADGATGLHRIYEDDSTIEVFDNTHTDLTGLTSTACYGVAFTPGRIWAAFDGGLVYTDDNGASFTVYDGTSTPTFSVADYSRIWFIQGDPVDANHHIGIAYNDESSHLTAGRCNLRLLWWDPSAGHGNEVTQLHVSSATSQWYPWRRIDIFRILECSPNDSVWGCSSHELNSNAPAMFSYNGTAATQTFPSYGSTATYHNYFFGWNKDTLGNDAMLVAWRGSTNSYFGLYQQDGTATRSDTCNNTERAEGSNSAWFNESTYGYKCITPGGMFIGCSIRVSDSYECYYMRPAWQSLAPFGGAGQNVLYDVYGWNGAAWVKDFAGSKPTHASSDTLIDGLTISFDDTPGAFVLDDYYTVGIIDGILADDATEFEHRYNLYYKKVNFGETDVEGGAPLSASVADYPYTLSTTDRGDIIDVNGVTTNGGEWNGTVNGWYARLNRIHTDEASVTWRVRNANSISEFYAGFANATKIGTTPITGTDIDYGVRVSPGILGSAWGWQAEVVANGVVVLMFEDGSEGVQTDDIYGNNNGRGSYNRNNTDVVPIKLVREAGSTDLKVYYRNYVVHTFTGVTADLVFTVRSASSNNDIDVDEVKTTNSDYTVALGNSGTNTGAFDPDLYAIDVTAAGRPTPNEILINGTPVTTLLIRDETTVLAAGEVSLFWNGYLRYSAADAGKTLTISRYNVLLHK